MRTTCNSLPSLCLVHNVLGVPGVQPERLAEGKEPKHCALSLVGEPIMYPEINTLVRLLHQKKISTFLVTNAQFPEAIRFDKNASMYIPSNIFLFGVQKSSPGDAALCECGCQH